MFLAFGEIMARIAPPGQLRWRQALPGAVQRDLGRRRGECLRVAGDVRAAGPLPDGAAADADRRGGRRDAARPGRRYRATSCGGRKAGWGCTSSKAGANQRGSTVIYDRADSAVSLAAAEEYDFAAALAGRQVAARDGHHAGDQRGGLPREPGAGAAGQSSRRDRLVRSELPQEAVELAAGDAGQSAGPRVHGGSCCRTSIW